MSVYGYERKSPPNRSTSALPAIPDLTARMSVFGVLTTASAQETDIPPAAAEGRC